MIRRAFNRNIKDLVIKHYGFKKIRSTRSYGFEVFSNIILSITIIHTISRNKGKSPIKNQFFFSREGLSLFSCALRA